MALKKVKGTLERVLDKNLQDLVRGIRNHKENEVMIVDNRLFSIYVCMCENGYRPRRNIKVVS